MSSELVYGVIRRQATLDAVLKPRLKRPPDQVEPPLWTLLQLGTYQLLFFSPDSHHASVHETVELCRWLEKSRWTGFANGVLRAVQRDISDKPANTAAADTIPIRPDQFLSLASPLMPDPGSDPNRYIASAGSLPDWLVENWSSRYDFEELLRMAMWFNTCLLYTSDAADE